ncbi:MAG: nitroreductase family protein [Defluviitaleaceae bacterium]|nr:nitroreductase family protein [Defluviitaleaceae bacterium]
MDAIKNRRSVRKYKENPVTKGQVETLLGAAMHAPSACNSRPWRFLVITNREVLDKLADAHKFAKMLRKAPTAIVICALAQEQEQNKIASGFYPQDCAAATQNILLAAQGMGLATCWCGVYPKEQLMPVIGEILGLSEDEIPFNIIAVGYADEEPGAKGFYDGEKVRWIT